jgi:hypothetical protein
MYEPDFAGDLDIAAWQRTIHVHRTVLWDLQVDPYVELLCVGKCGRP